jgi:hypothetical protein
MIEYRFNGEVPQIVPTLLLTGLFCSVGDSNNLPSKLRYLQQEASRRCCNEIQYE